MSSPFEPGTTVVRRESLHGQPWLETPVTVVADEGDVLAVLLRPGAPFTFFDHPHGEHPWHGRSAWAGPTVLQLHRSGDAYSVWMFFDGTDFSHWYVNFEAPLERWDGGFETGDHGLDLVIRPDGTAEWKDVHHLHTMLATARMAADEILGVLGSAQQVWSLLEQDQRWWADWDAWRPGAEAGSLST